MNILDSIYNISQLEELKVKEITFGKNRANNMGEGLESFIKDSFTNTFDEEDKNIRNQEYKKVYSFQGSKRNPPDLMIAGGPAIEIKKIESLTSELQLNSSHPKASLKATSPFITKKCRECEEWDSKDFIYVIGHVPKDSKTLSSLWYVYGDIYAAEESTYTSLKDQLSEKIEEIPDIDFSKTKEIGRINEVDPLKITNLRIRGMWLLKQPYTVFDYIHSYETGKLFQCFALIPSSKYDAFEEASRDRIESDKINFEIKDVEVNHPDNPVEMVKCKLIAFKMDNKKKAASLF